LAEAVKVKDVWRTVASSFIETPMPVRGEIVREIGQAFRNKKNALGRLISLEVGKILSEGLGEVQ